jgi:hypothetical protein
MKIIFKNTAEDDIRVYVEPSTDEILLKKDDVLWINSKLENSDPFEIHYREGSAVVWIPHGQSADFYINEKEIETICSQHVW